MLCTASLPAYCMTVKDYFYILGVVLNKNEYYINCRGQAKVLFFFGGGGVRETPHVVLTLVPVRHFSNDCGPFFLKLNMVNLHLDLLNHSDFSLM